MIQTLIKNSSFDGKFVAFKNFNDHTVVADGDTPKQALEKAAERGFVNPVVAFVPIKGMVQIY